MPPGSLKGKRARARELEREQDERSDRLSADVPPGLGDRNRGQHIVMEDARPPGTAWQPFRVADMMRQREEMARQEKAPPSEDEMVAMMKPRGPESIRDRRPADNYIDAMKVADDEDMRRMSTETPSAGYRDETPSAGLRDELMVALDELRQRYPEAYSRIVNILK